MPEKLETAELAVDTTNGNLYTKLDDGSVVHLNDAGEGGDGTGSSVHIGEAPPAGPQEGQQWMEVPADGDATMWIYDGDKWLQQPGGKDGKDGADGKDGVDGLWTDNGDTSISYNDGNVGIGVGGNTNNRPLKVQDSGSPLAPASVVADDDKTAGLLLGRPDSDALGRVSYDNALNQLQFFTNSTTQVVIDGDGNVGIGTDTPKGGNSVRLIYQSGQRRWGQYTLPERPQFRIQPWPQWRY